MVSIYLDENVSMLLAPLLRSRNINIIITVEAKMRGKSDEQQLAFASQHRLAIASHNRVDFEGLYRE